ncbi:MAG: HAMP domain-containing sensor histidine kinase [Acidobacteriota bacterium]
MLHQFITTHRADIIARSREKLTARPWPTATTTELHNGVPLFLTQLADTLRHEVAGVVGQSSSPTPIGATAILHGRELLGLGFTVSQVVHDYGDICQAVTELAIALNAPITTEEFHTLNRCLDTAIAGAVTEHARLTAESRSLEEVERAGLVAHETRDLLNTALLAFEALKRGTVAINGSTGAILARSLTSLRVLVDSSLADIRATARLQRREIIGLAPFLHDLTATSGLQAESRGVHLHLVSVEGSLAVLADRQLLTSAVMNLLSNAFKFTRPSGRVVLRASRREDHAVIEVEDECGGIPDRTGDPFQSFGEQRGADRTGLGLGLFIARKAVRAQGGDIYIRNLPGTGCVFSIEIPLAVESLASAVPMAAGQS